MTTTRRSRVGCAAIAVHRVRFLDPRDVTVRDGIPVTTVARVLLDLTNVARRDRDLKRAFHDADREDLLDAGPSPTCSTVARAAGPACCVT